MKIIDRVLWIEFADFLSAGWKEMTLKMANHRNGQYWVMMPDPTDKRRVLVKFDTLRQQHKDTLTAHFGDPYQYIAKEPIRSLVKPDHKAQEYYLAFKYTDGSGNLKSLPLEHQQKYSQAAAWLNMLLEMDKDKKAIRKQLNLDTSMIYAYISDIFKIDDVWLPTHYPKIRAKMAEYAAKGYDCLIDWRFGNQLAAKVKDEVSETVLLELISHPNQHDNTIIAAAYNSWAVKHDYKTIDPATVAVHRRKNMHLLQGDIQGNAAWYNNFGKIIHRNRPSAPLLLIGSDDNDLDLYFIDNRRTRRNADNHYFRFKLVVVMDAHNDYVLGYSYGETMTVELIKAAYLDALYHIKELTGDWYLMDQIQSDRFGFKALEPFYQSLATYTPARAKAPRGKYIEQAFGKKWHQVLKMFPNYAGQNITAKAKLNRDNIDLLKNDFPTIDKGPELIENFIHCMRMLKTSSGETRQAAWLSKFHESEKSKRHLISEERMLTLLGEPHEFTHRITNGGIKATIRGEQFVYEIPDELYLANVGKTVQLYVDHYDYSRVLVTDGGNVRFIARQFQKMPSALADFQEGDHKRLHSFLNEKKRHSLHIAAKKDQRKVIMDRQQIDSEGLLQAQVMVKGIKQNAELQYQNALLNGTNNNRDFDNYDPLDM